MQPEEISKLIQDGKVNLTVSEGSQGKHIKGHNNYIEGKSYITVPVEKIQLLVNKYASHGKLVYNKNGQWSKKEIIVSDDYVGYAVTARQKPNKLQNHSRYTIAIKAFTLSRERSNEYGFIR